MRSRFRLEKGNVIDMMIQYESMIEEQWYEIVRYDFAHGFFHRDLISPKGEKVKKKIEIDDMKLAALYAEQDLKDRWEWYKENYLKQIKKK
jgi:hypothetical protein